MYLEEIAVQSLLREKRATSRSEALNLIIHSFHSTGLQKSYMEWNKRLPETIGMGIMKTAAHSCLVGISFLIKDLDALARNY